MRRSILIVLIGFLVSLTFLTSPAGAASVDKAVIKVQGDDAEVQLSYSLSWWEKIRYGLPIIGGGEKQMAKDLADRLQDSIETPVFLKKVDTERDTATVHVEKYVTDRTPRREGIWYTTFGLDQKLCNAINLENVYVKFPDGFIYTYQGELPPITHLKNEKLAKMYWDARFRHKTYERFKNLYDPVFYREKGLQEIKQFSTDVMWELTKEATGSIATAGWIPIPYKSITDITDVKGVQDAFNSFNYEEGAFPPLTVSETEITISMLDLKTPFSNLESLTEKETTLIKKTVSEPNQYDKNTEKLRKIRGEELDNVKRIRMTLYDEDKTYLQYSDPTYRVDNLGYLTFPSQGKSYVIDLISFADKWSLQEMKRLKKH